ncbi:hypothetical protein ACJW31_12G018000 [Castanea mollissima]
MVWMHLPLKFTLLSPTLLIESVKSLTTIGTISMAFMNSNDPFTSKNSTTSTSILMGKMYSLIKYIETNF